MSTLSVAMGSGLGIAVLLAALGCAPQPASPPVVDVRAAPRFEASRNAPTPSSSPVSRAPVASAKPATSDEKGEAPKPEPPRMGVTVAEFHGVAAPGKVGQDFFDEVGEALGECFEAMQIRKPGALGKVLVRALVDKDGTTKAVALTEDTIGEPKFAACVVEEVEGMTLPASDAGTAVFEVESLRFGPGMSLTGESID